MRTIQKNQQGFTLIELVMVIVILGILAATALPKFVNLSTEANAAAAQGIAGALSAANGINVAGCAVAPTDTAKCTQMAAASKKCADIGSLVNPPITITEGAVPATTTQGALYITAANNLALTAAGVTCNFSYGNGGAGIAQQFSANATS